MCVAYSNNLVSECERNHGCLTEVAARNHMAPGTDLSLAAEGYNCAVWGSGNPVPYERLGTLGPQAHIR